MKHKYAFFITYVDVEAETIGVWQMLSLWFKRALSEGVPLSATWSGEKAMFAYEIAARWTS